MTRLGLLRLRRGLDIHTRRVTGTHSILLLSGRESDSVLGLSVLNRCQERSILSGEALSLQHAISMTQNDLSRIKDSSPSLLCLFALISLRIPWDLSIQGSIWRTKEPWSHADGVLHEIRGHRQL